MGTPPHNGTETDSDGTTSEHSLQAAATTEDPDPPAVTRTISELLALPEVTVAPSRRRAAPQEALVDYSQSLLMTSEDYVAAMAKKARRREEARVQSDLRRDQAQARRRHKEEEKLRKNAERANREAQKEARLAFKARWTKEAIRQAGERMQQLVKNPPLPAPGDYIAPYLGNLSRIYKHNMAL